VPSKVTHTKTGEHPLCWIYSFQDISCKINMGWNSEAALAAVLHGAAPKRSASRVLL